MAKDNEFVRLGNEFAIGRFIINFILSLFDGIFSVYFIGQFMPVFISSVKLIGMITEMAIYKMAKSQVFVAWLQGRYKLLASANISITIVVAMVGESHPQIRWLVITIVNVLPLIAMKICDTDNIAHLVKGGEFTTFNAQISASATFGRLVGTIGAIIVAAFIGNDIHDRGIITLCLFAEAIGLTVGSYFYVRANELARKLRGGIKAASVHDVIDDIMNG